METSGIGALTLLTVASVPGLYSGLLPDHMSITEAASDSGRYDRARSSVHHGLRQATGLSILLGLGTSIIARKPWPLIGCVAISAYLVWQYEKCLHPTDC